MEYFAPTIDETGLHIPTYSGIRDQLILEAREIFGADIYLGIDSQDYQWISAIAEKIYDSYQLAQLVYNNRSPQTAIGVALDSIVKLNGLKRKDGTYSTCLVTLAGTPGTVITNGIIADVNGNQWKLPVTITLDGTGSAIVTATSQTIGASIANPGDLTVIVTPTYGWTSVTNATAADVGIPTETDAELRSRQSLSASIRSNTMLEGVRSGLLSIAEVTRMEVYENDTNEVDSNGLPEHSITCVVENGSDIDVANKIYEYKGIGAYTNGDVEVPVTDSYGYTIDIRFYRPIYKDIDVVVDVKALAGYTTEITALIKQNIVDYLNGLAIGENMTVSSLWGISLAAMPNLKSPMFSITGLTAALHDGVQETADITIGYKEVTRGTLANITVNVS